MLNRLVDRLRNELENKNDSVFITVLDANGGIDLIKINNECVYLQEKLNFSRDSSTTFQLMIYH